MLKRVSSAIFLLVGVVIGLGAFGHGYSARVIHAAIDPLSIALPTYRAIIFVWYFVSGAMLTFGGTIIWIWFRVRAGDSRSLFAAHLISVLYLIFGVCTMVYTRGDPFGGLFMVLGALLMGSSLVLGQEKQNA
jgi:hypothetical protein